MSELQSIAGGGGSNSGSPLFALAQFRLGRVLLWFGVALLTISSFDNPRHDSLYLFVAAIFALTALIGHFFSARRKRKARASARSSLILWALVLVALFGALWLIFRRKKKVAGVPPTQQEIDAMILEADR